MQASIAFDFMIMNDGAQKLGYLHSEYVSPVVTNDLLTPAGGEKGQITMPFEFWLTADGKKTLLVQRGGVSDMRAFSFEFRDFVKAHGFASVALMTSAYSPVKRERDSNREIPEVFAYCNEHLEKQDYYTKNGIRKFGWWIEQEKKPFQKLKELGPASGWSARLYKSLNRLDMPVGLFCVFCQGFGLDFFGGFIYHQFLQKSLFNEGGAQNKDLGKPNL